MSSAISEIQTLLKRAGFYTGEIDGIAGKRTVQAVEQAVAETTDTQPCTDTEIDASKKAKFAFSPTSLSRLKGVDAKLINVVTRALLLSESDFAVICGLRTKEQQEEYVRTGKSKTMNSKHLIGKAVDLSPIVNGTISWDLKDYYPVVDAMRKSAKELGVRIRWGGSWDVLNDTTQDPDTLVKAYADALRKKGAKPFIDGPHFELV